MNSATFKTLCEAVGLEQEDIAQELDVNVRTVQRWWSTQDPIPAAEAYLQEIIEEYDATLEAELAQIDSLPEGESVTLTIYKNQVSFDRATGGNSPVPWKVYEAYVQQLALYVVQDGRPVEVIYVHSED